MYASPTTMDSKLSEDGSRLKKLLCRFGIAGFAFFFIKGMLWLLIPAVMYLMKS